MLRLSRPGTARPYSKHGSKKVGHRSQVSVSEMSGMRNSICPFVTLAVSCLGLYGHESGRNYRFVDCYSGRSSSMRMIPRAMRGCSWLVHLLIEAWTRLTISALLIPSLPTVATVLLPAMTNPLFVTSPVADAWTSPLLLLVALVYI